MEIQINNNYLNYEKKSIRSCISSHISSCWKVCLRCEYQPYNFKEITKNKVYKSGVIPPGKIEGYAKKYHIKSIVDLRFPGTKDTINKPDELPEELLAEKEAVENIDGVAYFNVGSHQVPSQETIDSFLEIMDNPR